MYIDQGTRSDPLKRRIRRQTPLEVREEALAFIDQFYREVAPDQEPARQRRRREVAALLRRHSHYDHTPEELAYGARLAWRNSARCIGRLLWKSLEVVDCRHVTATDEIAACILEHVTRANGEARTPSIISIFAPIRNKVAPAYVESAQILQFAGYIQESGGVIGDPANVEMTRTAISLGWTPPATPSHFDVLPIVIRDQAGRRLLYEMPPSSYRMIDITHPTVEAIGALGLRWYATPIISDMILSIGGIDYPCAPFNGFYMATEIASRNLTDVARYDRLADVASALGLDPADPLWRDVALTELNRAVLHSFTQAGVSIIDHHTASEQFVTFVEKEHTARRPTSADWSWIVPPQASAGCAVFHLPMKDLRRVPNFYRSRASDGMNLEPFVWRHEHRPRLARLDRLRRRLLSWARSRYAG